MKRAIISTWLILFCTALGGAVGLNVLAADEDANGIKLTISPLPINIAAEPGATVTHSLEIKNSGEKSETLAPNILAFSTKPDSGEAQLRNTGPMDDYRSWITFSPAQITVEPGAWGKTTMTIAVPKSAAYGYYFAVSWSRAERAPQQAAASLIGSVAQLVLLEVPAPGTVRQLAVESFATSSSSYEFLPVTFRTAIKNSGNIHAVPFGNIFISDGRGKTVDTLQVNPQKGAILPGSRRVYSTEWAKGFPVYRIDERDGKAVLNPYGNPQKSLEWDLSHAEWWRFGKYHASLVMAYSRNGQDIPLTAQTDFWVIPWRLIALVVALPTIPALAVYLLMRHKYQRSHHRTV